MTYLLTLALLPVFLLIVFIYRKDSVNPEPLSMIVKALVFGVLSCFVSLLLTSFLEDGDDFIDAFTGAALPEEFAKLLMLWLLVRKSKYFDEPIDAIVYAVCVSLGFAGFENILYLVDEEDMLSTGIMRALFSIPGHFSFAVCMGYFYALAHFGQNKRILYKILAYVCPVLLHGLYDGLLSINDDETWIIILPLWVIFCIIMYRKSLKRIAKIKEMTEQTSTDEQTAQ